MADISLVIDVKQNGVTQAVKNTKSLENSVKLLSKAWKSDSLSQRQYYKGLLELATASGKTEKELRNYANQLRAAEKAEKQATAAKKASVKAVREKAAALRAAVKTEKEAVRTAKEAAKVARTQANANRSLRMEFKEGYAAQVQLRAAQMRLNQARRQGIITDAEYKKQLGSLNVATQVAGRRMNSTGMAMQQTGYQVGDFLVQVQSGTNAMVAFGQQATQLVGILPMFNSFMGFSGTKLVALSAGLGIAIPLLTAIGAAFMRTRKDAEESSDGLDSYAGSLKAAREEIKQTTLELAALRGGFTDVLEYSLDSQIKTLENRLNPIMEDYNSYLMEQAKLIQEVGDVTQSDLVEALTDAAIQYRNSTEEGQKLLELEKALAKLLKQRGDQLVKNIMDAYKSGEDLSNLNLGKGIDSAAESARVLAERMGITLGLAQQLVALSAMSPEERRMDANITAGTAPPWARGDTGVEGGETPLGLQSYMDAVDRRVKEREDAVKAESKGSKEKDTLKETNLEKLREELNLMEELRGKTEEYTFVRQKLGDQYKEVGQETIDRLQAEYAGIQSLIDLEKQREQLMTGVGQSIADGFTAMVEGTMSVKDAFRNMAKEIIKQLWEIFVVQQIVGVVSQAFGVPKAVTDPAVSAMMSSWDGGGYTGSGARSGGMDGKGGFMAMLHPQETVVDHTKGQSSGGTTVQQTLNFNFSANGDDSVKKIIAQAAPQIAQMTQKSMMDQRRRGGSMKSTFG